MAAIISGILERIRFQINSEEQQEVAREVIEKALEGNSEDLNSTSAKANLEATGSTTDSSAILFLIVLYYIA